LSLLVLLGVLEMPLDCVERADLLLPRLGVQGIDGTEALRDLRSWRWRAGAWIHWSYMGAQGGAKLGVQVVSSAWVACEIVEESMESLGLVWCD
jgi:hypothetical protein